MRRRQWFGKLRPMKKTLSLAVVLLGLSLAVITVRAQMGDPTKVTLKTTPVVGNISMIEGANGFAGGTWPCRSATTVSSWSTTSCNR